LRIDRYLAHALVLATVVALSGYAADTDRHFPAYLTARPGTVNAEALVISVGGTVGDVCLGRYSTIIKPLAIPIELRQRHGEG
jgi:hypothetical protein